MKRLLNNNRFWALPEGQAENILRLLALGPGAQEAPAGGGMPAGARLSSVSRAGFEPAQPSALEATKAEGPVRVIKVDGVLMNGDSDGWYGMGYGFIKNQVQAALDDSAVKAIVLDVDSPGGSVAGCQELADFIAQAAKQKPMAAFTNSLMASAAYWVGSATGRVLCTGTAELGSIGVIMTLYDWSGLNEAWGLKVNVISSGKFKSAGHPDVPLSDEHREYFQTQSDGIHAVFRGSVAANMGIESPAEEWGDAQVFLGSDALKVGLASAVVSGLDEAVTMLFQEVTMDRATLEAKHPELVKELLAEGEAKAVAERSFTAENFLSCVKPFMGEADFAQAKDFFDKGAAAKLNPEQMAAMAAVFVQPKAEAHKEKDDEGKEKQAMLDTIQKMQAQAVPGDSRKTMMDATHTDRLVAAAKKVN